MFYCIFEIILKALVKEYYKQRIIKSTLKGIVLAKLTTVFFTLHNILLRYGICLDS